MTTANHYAQMSLLDAAQDAWNRRQSHEITAKRRRALELLDMVRETICLPREHADELLKISPDEVTIRDSGASMPVAVRGLYIFCPSDKAHSLTPVLVNKTTRAEIPITDPAEDLYAFIFQASIA